MMSIFYILNVFILLTSLYTSHGDNVDLEMIGLRLHVREGFRHAMNSYMEHAFPHDEIMPISCKPRVDKVRGTLDDVLGDYMLTLVDSLSTMIMLGEHDMFRKSIQLMYDHQLSFDKNINVSVFEASIRMLGGLVSAHMLAQHLYDDHIYDGQYLLNLAIDLGNRLLPAFSTRTGIPVHRVNLRYGMIANDTTSTCTAAGTSYLVEFALLSRLSSNPIYEKVAYKAIKIVWSRRSALNLVGALIDTSSGKWIQHHTGIGAGIDSFYETMFKSSILLGDDSMLSYFDDAYFAIMNNTFLQSYHNIEVSMNHGKSHPHSAVISSLGGFWPALQVLSGRIYDAINSFISYEKIWDQYDAIPDMYDLQSMSLYSIYGRDYPLRPELVESAYHLYLATKDHKYLMFGKKVWDMIESKCRVRCGYASIADVETGRLDDRMDSYFLAETIKYLYLLFDEGISDPKLRISMFCHGTSHHSTSYGHHHDDHIQQPFSSTSCKGNDTIIDVHPMMADHIDMLPSTIMIDPMLTSATDAILSTTVVDETILSQHHDHITSTTTESSCDEIESMSKINSVHTCIPQQSALFTTEGHVILLHPSIRSSSSSSKEKSKKSSPDRLFVYDICPAPILP